MLFVLIGYDSYTYDIKVSCLLVFGGRTPESEAGIEMVPVTRKPKQLKIVPKSLQWKLK